MKAGKRCRCDAWAGRMCSGACVRARVCMCARARARIQSSSFLTTRGRGKKERGWGRGKKEQG
eukprot:1139137-Pelagomonas_calceolata.AAC.2